MKKLNSASIFSVVFLLGILVMLNAIGIRYFLRTDLTSAKIYSLSKASKDVAAKLEDKVLIKAYFSPDLPAQYNTIGPYLRDMLEDYRAFSHGRIQYEFVSPGDEKKLSEEADSFQIPARQVQIIEKDKIEVKRVYMGAVFIYRDKKETFPVIENTDTIEYEITSLIKHISSNANPILGIASTGSQQQETSMQRLYEGLGRNYNVQPVSLDSPVEKSVTALLVLAPRQTFTDTQLFNLDQYIMNGGKVGIFANSYRLVEQQQQTLGIPYNLNLNGLLNTYGIGLGEDMVIDVKCNAIQVPSQQGFIRFVQTVQIPYMPIIGTFNKRHVITRDIQQVMTFFPSSVDTTLAVKKGFKAEGLMYTSGFSGRQSGPVVYIMPLEAMKKTDFLKKNIPLAAIVTGKFTSYYAQSGPPADSTSKVSARPFLKECEKENRIVVVGDGNMALDMYVRDPRQIVFIQNVADWLVQAEDMISIRSKELPLRPLKNIGDMGRNLVKWTNMVGPSVLVIIMGIALWRGRVIRKKATLSQYEEGRKTDEE
jgi:gliding-associated putative ABC transporter substrate-binding component GldG